MKLSLVISLGVLSGCEGGGGESGANSPQLEENAEITQVNQEPKVNCSRESWVAGTVEWCEGRLAYYDYIYDDYGADRGLISLAPTLLNVLNRGGQLGSPIANTPGLLSPTAGDERYPEGLLNTSDLVKLHVEKLGGTLKMTAELNTLYNPDDAILGVALDLDPGQSTGGGHWGRIDVSSDGWDQVHFQDRGDPNSNKLVLKIPAPTTDSFRLQAVVAQKTGTVMNVAFRGIHEGASAGGGVNQVLPSTGNWWDERQAQALGRGDISEFGVTIELQDFETRRSDAIELPSGFYQRVYTSDYPLGEGVAIPGITGRDGGGIFCGQSFNYLGKYQPYGIYVPESAVQPGTEAGMQVVMHGCEANHASQINQANMQQRFGDALNRILVSPLARGPHGFYTGPSERDVLDVMEDVQDTYSIDAKKVFASGYSMGGYGALHFATHYPDRFAGVVNWVGYTGDLFNIPELLPVIDELLAQVTEIAPRAILGELLGSIANSPDGFANVVDYTENLRHVPSAHLYAAADELVQVNQALALAQRLESTSTLDYSFYLHPVAEHLTFLVLDDWRKEALVSASWVLEENPANVAYTFDSTFDYPEFNIKHDSAYWISNLVARESKVAQIKLSGSGCRSVRSETSSILTLGLDPVPWSGMRGEVVQRPGPVTSELIGKLLNIGSATIDVDDICLADMPIYYRIESDGEASLIFSDGRTLAIKKGLQEGVL
ncbi:prolyl oligopeptidase family serine peptidase [Marinobacter sp. AL4B]|uniref:prolyl oligopeptidase family serine peptidase n=1 Tax=Marinobacter sp. AL4B TaxID=2871173 RepID=UPI001CAA7BAF|nr:prolyl oligopeptidase family serine peptidase [Marinobacter sp. AL4B]MBZ0332712.1 prolyl oligopeptidase family serine peptidase [Marinobacter sp. AL4B]